MSYIKFSGTADGGGEGGHEISDGFRHSLHKRLTPSIVRLVKVEMKGQPEYKMNNVLCRSCTWTFKNIQFCIVASGHLSGWYLEKQVYSKWTTWILS